VPRSSVAAGDLLDAALQGAGDVGLVDDVEGAERVGIKNRSVQQILGQLEGGNADDAVLFVTNTWDSGPTSRACSQALCGKGSPSLQLGVWTSGPNQRKSVIHLTRRQ